MIAIDQIRIGNYVDFLQDANLFLPSGGNLVNTSVVTLVKVKTITDNKINNQPLEKFEPIILTPRLIDLLGYEKENDWVKIGSLKFQEFQDPADGSYNYSISVQSEDIHPTGLKFFQLENLHDLQNLYFGITNEEMPVSDAIFSS